MYFNGNPVVSSSLWNPRKPPLVCSAVGLLERHLLIQLAEQVVWRVRGSRFDPRPSKAIPIYYSRFLCYNYTTRVPLLRLRLLLLFLCGHPICVLYQTSTN